MHRVVALALPSVVAFDLSVVAQIFGHVDEREHYRFVVCAERAGRVHSTTGFGIDAPAGLDALAEADTVVVPGFGPLDDPSDVVLEAQRLLEATDLTVDDIARRCGLGTAVSLRAQLARHAGTTPSAYRAAFRSSH